MDNDVFVLRHLKKWIKMIKYRVNYRDLEILGDDLGNQMIQNMILSNEPFLVARGGATEMRCIAEYLVKRDFSEKIKDEVSILSGVFPNDTETLRLFCRHYIKCIEQADLLALWGVGAESRVVHRHCKEATFTGIRALEPYYFEQPWSAALKGKKVLVVHPFAQTIQEQYERRKAVWPHPFENILPEFGKLICLKAVQSIAGQKTQFASWFLALQYMESEIDQIDFDIAIIGAGAYGLPLASYCKSIGKQAIHMAGATQILFGIMGKRWDRHPIISGFYNPAWVRPLQQETPNDIRKVEGGSYW